MQPRLDLNPAVVTSNFHHLPSSCRPLFLQQPASSKQQAVAAPARLEIDRHEATVPLCHGILPARLHLPLQRSVVVAAPWALAHESPIDQLVQDGPVRRLGDI
jgi:hypothetical protein